MLMFARRRPIWARSICLLPFLVSMLIPVGMMPAVSGNGVLTFVVCTAHGLQERSFPAPDEEPQSTSSWCLFSLLSAPVLRPASSYAFGTDYNDVIEPALVELDAEAALDVATARPRGPPFIL